ncbi:hypothetical protein SEA_LOZINAK_77 [Gordonia phage Lozinak]|uniref:Uncharacterized protein n=4 Tax=Smoothievirus TaxID=1982557 RepID=A0A2D1GG04_9CAUD|nr:hypothetical protein BEN60_gp129 [Gordonia phage Smoothie]YP_009276189.1 hypothetical protein BH772_gp133 [Gordonia phage Bachita]YP_009281232.1 hypothetical protein BIZ74_gp127 [Gordonia phage Cucurbita]ATN90703.1 hypothetical protein SEA_LOZINAK_77 [Gordonia phage Lozinak]AUE23646.1 hypothetical protein SEA_TONIANN_77 [Gordonia phage Toniann]QAU06941.1 hypothetical protein SEA_APHELION_76 [Gordonia phage Aphelion]QKY79654.1 hypothetical protein SEA_ENGINEER_78 [Gordonia Phage Engineer]Q
MTRATKETEKITRHRFIAPCDYGVGGDIGTFMDAMHWAQQKAMELGRNTGSDDWARVFPEDDQIVIVVEETQKA